MRNVLRTVQNGCLAAIVAGALAVPAFAASVADSEAPIAASGPASDVAEGLNPQVAVADNGDFVVTWWNNLIATDQFAISRVYFRQYNADGTPKGRAQVVRSFNGIRLVRYPDVSVANDGSFSIAAIGIPRDEDGKFTDRHVLLQRFDANGRPNGEMEQFGDQAIAVALGKDASDNLVASWNSVQDLIALPPLAPEGDGGEVLHREVFYFKRYDALGNPRGPERFVNDTFGILNGKSTNGPALGVQDDGSFVVLYSRSAYRHGKIYGQSYDADGTVEQLFQLPISRRDDNLVRAFVSQPAIGLNRNDGSFVAGWIQNDEDSVNNENGITPIIRRFSADQKPLTTGDPAFSQPADASAPLYSEAAGVKIAVQPDGAFSVVAARPATDSQLDQVVLRGYDANGQPIADAQVVDTVASTSRSVAALDTATDQQGDLVVVYQISDIDNPQIKVRRYQSH